LEHPQEVCFFKVLDVVENKKGTYEAKLGNGFLPSRAGAWPWALEDELDLNFLRPDAARFIPMNPRPVGHGADERGLEEMRLGARSSEGLPHRVPDR
jgi:hypothetical protein